MTDGTTTRIFPPTRRLNNASHAGGRFWVVVTALTVLFVCVIVLWSAPAPIMAPWDVLILLDGGYRILQGQVPSSDFSNPIGPLIYELVSVGMRLQRTPSLASVAYGNTFFLAITSGLSWYATKGRLPDIWRAGVTVFVAWLPADAGPRWVPIRPSTC